MIASLHNLRNAHYRWLARLYRRYEIQVTTTSTASAGKSTKSRYGVNDARPAAVSAIARIGVKQPERDRDRSANRRVQAVPRAHQCHLCGITSAPKPDPSATTFAIAPPAWFRLDS